MKTGRISPPLLICLLLALLTQMSVQAQEKQTQSDSYRPQMHVFLSPLKVLDMTNSGILYGGGVTLPYQLGVELGHLILLPGVLRYSRPDDKWGHRFHLGIKRYFQPSSASSPRVYLQLRGDLLSRKHRSVLSFYTEEAANNPVISTTYEDSVTVRSRITTINAMVGIEFPIGKRFSIDYSMGLGLRRRYVRHEDLIDPDKADNYVDLSESWFDLDETDRQEGYLNIPLDLRIFYRLN